MKELFNAATVNMIMNTSNSAFILINQNILAVTINDDKTVTAVSLKLLTEPDLAMDNYEWDGIAVGEWFYNKARSCPSLVQLAGFELTGELNGKYTVEEIQEYINHCLVPQMTIVNLTPHSIAFVNEDNDVVTVVNPSGTVARVTTKTVVIGNINDIPITTTEFGEVENLPDPVDGTIYIVSSLVAQRCTHRNDVYIPNESVRDDSGRIIGCRSLGRI